jgi:hypothetical protein
VWKNYNISEQNKTFSNGENFSAEMDFRKNFHNKWSFRTGGKLLLTQRDSRLNTIDALSGIRTDSNWDYKENIGGGYIGASKEITPDMFAYISLRAENTHIKGKSSDSSGESLTKEYTNWFPYVYFSHKLSSTFSYDLTYTKNIFRPPFSLMNGYSNRISDILYDKGNPELKPELTDVFTLSAKSGKHSSSLTYRNTSNAITEFFEIADNITYHTNINYGKTNSITLDYNYNGNLLSWWQTNLYLAGLYTKIPESYNRKYIWGGFLSWNNRFFFEKIGEFSLGLDANTPTISGNAYHKGAYLIDIAYSRSLCKDALNVRIGINDLFNSWKIRNENQVPTLDYRFYAKNQTRQLWCSITYNFSIRSKVSKERLINNNTIENRL